MKAIEDGLRRLDGVAKIQTDLQRNLVGMTPRSDVAVDLASIPQRIQQAGFRAGAMWIVTAGSPDQTRDGRPGFRIRNWSEPLPLEGAKPELGSSAVFQVVVEGDQIMLRPGLLPSGAW